MGRRTSSITYDDVAEKLETLDLSSNKISNIDIIKNTNFKELINV